MKQYSTTYLCLVLIFIGLTFKSQAAVCTNTAIDTVLVIEQIFSEKEIPKRRIYKRGEKIAYKIKGDNKIYKGDIIGFSDTELIIKDKNGVTKNIALSDLDRFRRRNSYKSVLSVLLGVFGVIVLCLSVIVLCLFVITIALIILLIPLLFIIGFALETFLVNSLIFFSIAVIPMILGFLGNRPFRSYKFGKKWKAKISTIQKVDE